ncbi:MAG: tagaturonate epimerase family protein [Promethearchaeota archaeon]
MKLQKYSIGTGDRFGCQGKAQLKAVIEAQKEGLDIAIVWNKSHREHLITKTTPSDVLYEAQNAVDELKWNGNYYIDADHISLSNVDSYIDSCNFFTLDLAEFIGKKGSDVDINSFIEKHKKYTEKTFFPSYKKFFKISKDQLKIIAENYLLAIKEAGKIYRKIKKKKSNENFLIEISMDESKEPQTPTEIFFILAAIADEKIPINTFAPKFCGNFYKGVDFEGNIKQFTKEFEILQVIIQFAKQQFSLGDSLKLSIHSGSDKFSLYKIINKIMKKYNTGVHLKTSGTTWLEELIGLTMSGDEGLTISKEIYNKAYNRFDEVCRPYISVINIDKTKLPNPKIVDNWNTKQFVRVLNHDISCKDYNPNFRQLLHVSYKIAAEMGSRYINAVKKCEEFINPKVIENLYKRHIKKLFL